MAILNSRTRQSLLLSDLEIAEGFWSRGLGLLGRSGLRENQGLWLRPGNSIHTCFMRFSIDCVFVDREMRVKAVRENIVPWRFVLPVRGADSVIEMAAGSARRLGIEVGEELHVGAESS